MKCYVSLPSFDVQFMAHNSRMTELEQWKLVLPKFHLHAEIASLGEFLG